MTSVIIDCDPGHDDALAILLAAKHLDVLGITTVSGNESIDNVTTNALKLVEVGNLTHIPVVRGAEGPLLREAVYAPQVHGKSGMDGAEIPEPTTKLKEGHAVDFIIDTVMSTSDVVLLPMGPLTNIALALRKEPRLRDRVKLMSIMGGSSTNGNITPTAEFNIYVDAEAADAEVFGTFSVSVEVILISFIERPSSFAAISDIFVIKPCPISIPP